MTGITRMAVLVLAVVIGYSAAVVVGSPDGIEPAPTPEPESGTAVPMPTTTLPGPMDPEMTSTTSTPASRTYLVWSTGGLSPELVTALTAGFADVSIVKGDVVELSVADGVIPLDALAIDPQAHANFDPAGLLNSLEPGTVVLGDTSAALRQAGPGDSLILNGVQYEVAAVVPDSLVSASEVVFTVSDPHLPVSTDRFALVHTDLPRIEVEAAVRDMYDGPAPLRIRDEGETPWLRHGDAVLPQVFIKRALGEFSYTSLSGGEFTQSSEFRAEHIATAHVPILGEVTCHTKVTEMLAGAMSQLLEEGLGHLVDPAGFAGCWNPRFIRSVTGTSSGISRHAWGAAVDINARANPIGSAGSQDPRLIEIMLEWGFTWGGDWLVPDPMHFEYAIDPG